MENLQKTDHFLPFLYSKSEKLAGGSRWSSLTLSVPGGDVFSSPHGKSDAIFLWVEIFISTLDEFFN